MLYFNSYGFQLCIKDSTNSFMAAEGIPNIGELMLASFPSDSTTFFVSSENPWYDICGGV